MKDFSYLKKNLKADFSGKKNVKVAVLGNTATQFYVQALRGLGFDSDLDLQIFEADFNQIERQVFDPVSELYDFNPEIIIIFQATHKLLNHYNKLKPDQCIDFADQQVKWTEEIIATIHSRTLAKIIFMNYPEIDDAVFGNFANKIEMSFLYQLRKLNFALMQIALSNPDFHICDLSSIQNQWGRRSSFQASIYVQSDMVLSIEIIPFIAKRTLDIIETIQGKFKKCLVLDLDNTLWGGIIGDDGMENIQLGSLGIGKAFTEFQYWIKKLKNRGVILAICSKNTEAVAKEPFEKHPDMVLKLDDIAVFIANWENKASNIREIQQILNIGFDSMVFLDDNPFERNLVRSNIPELCVPELPEDPAEYLEFLYSLNLFETLSYSAADLQRTQQYQTDTLRINTKKEFKGEDEFLQSLEMYSLVEAFNAFNTPRVAQLSQRSNQFNLRTVRYTESDILRLSQQENYHTFAFTLEDKFGDNGLIAVVVLREYSYQTLFIENWLMSCRVLKRGMEDFTLNVLANFAKEKGYQYLQGEYIPTAKNEMVKDHYQSLGFKQKENFWELDLNLYQMKSSYITKK